MDQSASEMAPNGPTGKADRVNCESTPCANDSSVSQASIVDRKAVPDTPWELPTKTDYIDFVSANNQLYLLHTSNMEEGSVLFDIKPESLDFNQIDLQSTSLWDFRISDHLTLLPAPGESGAVYALSAFGLNAVIENGQITSSSFEAVRWESEPFEGRGPNSSYAFSGDELYIAWQNKKKNTKLTPVRRVSDQLVVDTDKNRPVIENARPTDLVRHEETDRFITFVTKPDSRNLFATTPEDKNTLQVFDEPSPQVLEVGNKVLITDGFRFEYVTHDGSSLVKSEQSFSVDGDPIKDSAHVAWNGEVLAVLTADNMGLEKPSKMTLRFLNEKGELIETLKLGKESGLLKDSIKVTALQNGDFAALVGDEVLRIAR
jgi:hypothetical protein